MRIRMQKITRTGLIAAVYVVLCVAFGFISYGPLQLRFAEGLTLLPILCPEAVVGLTIGCFIANLIGGIPVDMVVGTLATLLAALATRKLRGVRFKGLPLAAALPPVLFNAVIVGAQLTILYFPAGSGAGVWAYNMLTVGAGQFAACFAIGVPLVVVIEKTPALKKAFTGSAY